jgi:hypothetical protein
MSLSRDMDVGVEKNNFRRDDYDIVVDRKRIPRGRIEIMYALLYLLGIV